MTTMAANTAIMAFTQQLRCHFQKSPTMNRYRDTMIGLALILLIQLVTAPLQIFLDSHSVFIPASIIFMLLALGLMMTANWFNGEVDRAYGSHIRGPVDFLGRHMSFGFVASFVMLNQDHIATGFDVLKIAGAFGESCRLCIDNLYITPQPCSIFLGY
jgi:hypothetical protein